MKKLLVFLGLAVAIGVAWAQQSAPDPLAQCKADLRVEQQLAFQSKQLASTLLQQLEKAQADLEQLKKFMSEGAPSEKP